MQVKNKKEFPQTDKRASMKNLQISEWWIVEGLPPIRSEEGRPFWPLQFSSAQEYLTSAFKQEKRNPHRSGKRKQNL